MSQLLYDLIIEGRHFMLVLEQKGGIEYIDWYEGRMLVQRATAFEVALGTALIRAKGQIAQLMCAKMNIQDCFECANVGCPMYWGPANFKPRIEKDTSMPPKKQIKAAIRKGVNPYAVAQSMVNKGKISPAKKERAVKSITKSVLKGKSGKGKSCGKK